MFIRYKDTGGVIRLVNCKIDSYISIYAENNKLVFEDDMRRHTITLESNEKAEEARDLVFVKIGSKRPLSNILDLLPSEEAVVIEEEESAEETDDQDGDEEEKDNNTDDEESEEE